MAGKSAILAVKIIGDASNAIGSMGKAGVAVAGLGTAAVAAGALVGKAFYDIGAAATDMDNEIRIGTGATGEALEGMQDTARDIAKQVPNSLGEVGTAVADLNTNLGLTGPVLDTVGRQVLEAGRMLGEDIDIKNAASTLNGFNVTAEETPAAMDDIFRVSQATGSSMNELTGQLSTQSGVLSELGLDLGDSAALIGGLSKAGIDSNAVLKGMGRSMTDLAKDGEPTADAFNRVMGEMQGFIDTGDTAAAMDLATDLFGTRAAPQFISALESGALSMEDLMGATGATQDTILGLADETRTAGQQWDILKNNAMLALEPIGTVIFGAVGDALGSLAAWIGTIDFSPIQEFADQIGPALGEFAGQAGDVLLPILSELGPMLTQAAQGGAPLQAMFAAIVPHLQTIGTAVLGLLPSAGLVRLGSAAGDHGRGLLAHSSHRADRLDRDPGRARRGAGPAADRAEHRDDLDPDDRHRHSDADSPDPRHHRPAHVDRAYRHRPARPRDQLPAADRAASVLQRRDHHRRRDRCRDRHPDRSRRAAPGRLRRRVAGDPGHRRHRHRHREGVRQQRAQFRARALRHRDRDRQDHGLQRLPDRRGHREHQDRRGGRFRAGAARKDPRRARQPRRPAARLRQGPDGRIHARDQERRAGRDRRRERCRAVRPRLLPLLPRQARPVLRKRLHRHAPARPWSATSPRR